MLRLWGPIVDNMCMTRWLPPPLPRICWDRVIPPPTAPLPPYAPSPVQVLDVLCGASEYDELPVRHNEDVLNTQLAREVRPTPALHHLPQTIGCLL